MVSREAIASKKHQNSVLEGLWNCHTNFKEEYEKCQESIEEVLRKSPKNVENVSRHCQGSAKKDSRK